MSYTKQTWANGDVITAEKLNHMEDGIAGGVFTIHVTATFNQGQPPTFTDVAVTESVADILSAYNNGSSIFMIAEYNQGTNKSSIHLMPALTLDESGAEKTLAYITGKGSNLSFTWNVAGGTEPELMFG